MNKAEIRALLEQVKKQELEVDTALKAMEDLPYKELGFAKIDNELVIPKSSIAKEKP